MKVTRSDEAPREDISQWPIFTGGEVSRYALVGLGGSNDFNFNIISFAAGVRNRLHTHTSDQVLFVTSGTGIVATENEQAVVREGDTVLIPADEKHWHGATADSDFAHIALTRRDSKTEIV